MNRFRKGIGALILIGGLVAFLPSCKTVKPVVFHNLTPMSFDSLFYEIATLAFSEVNRASCVCIS